MGNGVTMIWISLIGLAIQAIMFIIKLWMKEGKLPPKARAKFDQLLITCDALLKKAGNEGMSVPDYNYDALMEDATRARKPKGF